VGLGPPEYHSPQGVSQNSSRESAPTVRMMKPEIMRLDSQGVQRVFDVCGPSVQKSNTKECKLTKTKILLKLTSKIMINKSIKLRYQPNIACGLQ
jgi:hypothetical protein